MAVYVFEAELWLAGASEAWTFLTLPLEVSDDVGAVAGPPRGFGSVRVEVTIGATTWLTSVFPDAASRCYVLPVKRAVRRAEDVEAGDTARVALSVVDAHGQA